MSTCRDVFQLRFSLLLVFVFTFFSPPDIVRRTREHDFLVSAFLLFVGGSTKAASSKKKFCKEHGEGGLKGNCLNYASHIPVRLSLERAFCASSAVRVCLCLRSHMGVRGKAKSNQTAQFHAPFDGELKLN